MTMTCNRPFGHLPHETTQGPCDGLLHADRDTRCPHPGCDHHAATPDRAHALPVGLVDHLTLLGSDHGPALVLEATAALWPTLAAAGESAAYDRGMVDASTALALDPGLYVMCSNCRTLSGNGSYSLVGSNQVLCDRCM